MNSKNAINPVKTVILGVCAMDVKARSKAMREILTRLVERARGTIEVKVFGDKVLLDEGRPPASGLSSLLASYFPSNHISLVLLRC